MILDESQRVKNEDTLNFDISNVISSKCDFTYLMTGTPFGRDPRDLWAQFYLMDRGETFGMNKSIFEQVYFDTKTNLVR